jgi:uncharacterized protein YdeI (YjbR/CyaY-like superfamily)
MAKILTGTVHRIPKDFGGILGRNEKVLELWSGLTPLARNEWICWITSAKKPETRTRRIERTCTELTEGKRRPCCWPGCPHR